jgi:hypothetical protein
MDWRQRKIIEQREDEEHRRSTLRHEAAHAIVSTALNRGSVKRVVVRADGTGFCEVCPSVKVSRFGQQIIAAASGLVDSASPEDLEHHSERWPEARHNARVLLDAHMPEFEQLVVALEKLGDVPGSFVDLIFEMQEKVNRASAKRSHENVMTRQESGLRYRDLIWCTR